MQSKQKQPQWLERGKIRYSVWFGGRGWLRFWTPIRPGWKPIPREIIMSLKSEDCIKKVADAGYNLVWTDYSRGAGPTREKSEREESKEFVNLCHQYAIRVLPYIQFANVWWQDFLKDFPESLEWWAKDPTGEPVTYPNYPFRYIICINNQGWVNYLKKVIREILVDAKADGINIDNVWFPSNGCYCHICREKFREYMKNKYSISEINSKFRLASYAEINPPTKVKKFEVDERGISYIETRVDITEKITREWVRFKTENVNRFLSELRDCVKALSPEAIITGNTWSIALENKMVNQSMDVPTIGKIFDMLFMEGHLCPRTEFLMGESYMVSSIREYKYGLACAKDKVVAVEPLLQRRLQTPQLYVTPSPELAKRIIAEGLACGGYGTVAVSHEDTIITTEDTTDILEAIKSYNLWMAKHTEYFVKVKSGTNVALLRSEPTLFWDWENSFPHLTDFEQILIQAHIPYDVVLDEDLVNNLRKYDVLILPNVTCLSDNHLEVIKKFVDEGKGLVVTCDTARYNEERELREESVVAELVGTRWQTKEKAKKIYGQGRVVFYSNMPGISALFRSGFAVGKAPNIAFPRLPDNWGDIVESIRWAADNKFPAEIKAPKTVFAHLWEQSGPRRILLHLVNYSPKSVKEIEVGLRVPQGLEEPSSLSLFSPDLDEPLSLGWKRQGRYLVFTVPQLKIYDLICAEF